MSEKLFEKSSREKVRFHFKGILVVEDLWDLPKPALSEIYSGLSAKLRELGQDSLMQKPTKAVEELQLKADIVKYIYGVKEAEEKEREEKEARLQAKKDLLAIRAEKQAEGLKTLSLEELDKRIAEL